MRNLELALERLRTKTGRLNRLFKIGTTMLPSRHRQWKHEAKALPLATEAVETPGKGAVVATKAVKKAGKGAVVATKAVKTPGKGSVVTQSLL